ncbi:MAG: phospho-N-acetylmuramoyl-pentapeptide-transferase [Gammaproteobacteria bacterium]|nr:phospho-N-acetylmuramoyl-pentapeptide-transferase [Gammaproteobacteria bacterium]
MIALLISAAVAFVVSILATPWALRKLREHNIGQFIQEEVSGHLHKQGTPTMGGVVMIGAVLIGYLVSHVRVWGLEGFRLSVIPLSSGGLLALLALTGMGAIGLVDDYLKVSKKRSLGLGKAAKFGGQLTVAALFAWGATNAGISTELSFTRPLGIDLGVFFVVLVLVMLAGTANAVNLTDGMDGLAAGSAALVFGAFVIIGFWQFRHPEFYNGLDPLELGVVSAAMLGALLGFLWWNAAPARIFMGDVGSQALGGLMAALALLTNTQLLLILLGGLYVAETVSVILQVASFKLTGRRIFRMAPFHYHFDLGGWPETTVVVRFWIIAGLCVALALGIFYGDFVNSGLLDVPFRAN